MSIVPINPKLNLNETIAQRKEKRVIKKPERLDL